jgi:uncharacterized membrane protein
MSTLPSAEDVPASAPPNRLRGLRNAFLTGLIILVPLGVSVFVVNFLLQAIGDPASSLFFPTFKGQLPKYALYLVNLVSTLIVIVLITVLGYASQYLIGKWLLGHAEGVMLRVPFIGLVYRTTKQIVDTFRSQQKAVFQKVVLIEFPRKGTYGIGFITSTAQGELQLRTSQHVVNVFVPTTPNPTSGFLIVCPADELIELEMSVGDGMKLIISGGAVVPPFPPRPDLSGPVTISQPTAAAPFSPPASP